MGILLALSTLALRQVVEGACAAAAKSAGSTASDSVTAFLADRFTDHSARLTRALERANHQAWSALEITLAGEETLWDRCRVLLSPKDHQTFRGQVRAFLAAAPHGDWPGGGADFAKECLDELRAARKASLLTGDVLEPSELARRTRAFGRFADPAGLLESEWRMVKGISRDLAQHDFKALARLLELRPVPGSPLLVTAVRYFFRREVEKDAQLSRGLAWATWAAVADAQKAGFDSLAGLLAEHGERLERLEALLDDLRASAETTAGDVLDIKAELSRQGQQLQHLGQQIVQALQRHQVSGREVRPGDSLSIRTEDERRWVRTLVTQYRGLPPEQRNQLPALLNALGKLEVAAGDFDEAQTHFREVTRLVATDPRGQAEAHFNLYRAALEKRDWDAALQALRHAIRGDARRFAPFPVESYRPERILGAGGFGVAFLCHHGALKTQVVVKSLTADGLGQDADQVFGEARLLTELNHPAIIRLWDCGYHDNANAARPYLVMDYFDGVTLEDHVRQKGPLSPQDARAVARQVGEALHAVHERHILHRDVKPANVLVRRGESGWQVRLIDFGLALKQSLVRSEDDPTRQGSILGSSIAGTREYAAPEQMGLRPEARVGTRSDIYGFGKTFFFAMLRRPEPSKQEKKALPAGWKKLLEDCTQAAPEERPPGFGEVLARLMRIRLTKAARRAKVATPLGPGGQPATAAASRPSPAPSSPQTAPGQADHFRLSCPNCGKRLEIRVAALGRRVRCPSCGHELLAIQPKG